MMTTSLVITMPENESIIEKVTDEAIGILVTAVTMAIVAYQAATGQEITMLFEPMLLIIGFYFGNRK